jgi:mRNA interferase MazF
MSGRNDYRLGSIWLVQFDPSVGTEIRKTRPAVVVSGEMFNRQRSKVTLLPLTSVKLDKSIAAQVSPALVTVKASEANGLTLDSLIVCVDPATFDKSRFVKCLGQLETNYLQAAQSILQRYLQLSVNR